MKLSMLLSGIRTQNWHNLYKSIANSCTNNDWELVIVSPYELPEEIRKYDNIQWRQDWGSPCRCQQIALTMAKGDWIAWTSDDCTYLPNAIDESFTLVGGGNTIVVSKYLEGDDPISMDSNEYYRLRFHESMRLKGIPEDAFLLNCGLVSRKLLIDLGGWDASKFEVLPLAYTDFSLRALRYGVKFFIQEKPVCSCTHMPGMTGDHGPVHTAQTFRDMPMFNMLYCKPTDRMVIDIDNWKNTPEIWKRRFNERDPSKT